jgi:hypothetical protein
VAANPFACKERLEGSQELKGTHAFGDLLLLLLASLEVTSLDLSLAYRTSFG